MAMYLLKEMGFKFGDDGRKYIFSWSYLDAKYNPIC
jgi:hypothetical protein